MYSCVYSASIQGIESSLIKVETDVSNGMPVFEMVGDLHPQVREAKERVRASLRNAGLDFPVKRITISLSPATIRKSGAGFDLPIALGLLVCMGIIREEALENTIVVGELGLNGKVTHVDGILPIVSDGKNNGYKKFIIPKANYQEGKLVEGVTIYGAESLAEVIEVMNGKERNEENTVQKKVSTIENVYAVDFNQISGQDGMKRACEIAVAGMHNILLLGPPGSGKTMAAKRIPSILPEMTREEELELTKIYSVSGLLRKEEDLVRIRPFRSPHHSITGSALIGGGRTPRPGEISLAHSGVLFLDELPEFKKSVLELLRQPMEEKEIQISRINGSYKYPSDFMFVAAMNPCKCGFFPSEKCSCSDLEVSRYLGKISKPLLERIDLCVEAPPVKYHEIISEGQGESSQEIRRRVETARQIQKKRYQYSGFYFNAAIPTEQIKGYCHLEKKEEELMEGFFIKMNLSVRSYHRILKVARTIADLEGEEQIKERHLCEAICYRSLDKKYWEKERGF